MPTDLENYYLRFPEPIQGCLLALKDLLLNANPEISHQRKYQIPFFYYRDKQVAYLWVNQKKISLGFIGDKLPGDKRKIVTDQSFLINPNVDLPVAEILEVLKVMISKSNSR